MQSINATTSLRSHGLLRPYGGQQWLIAHWQRQGLLSSPGQRIPTEIYAGTPIQGTVAFPRALQSSSLLSP